MQLSAAVHGHVCRLQAGKALLSPVSDVIVGQTGSWHGKPCDAMCSSCSLLCLRRGPGKLWSPRKSMMHLQHAWPCLSCCCLCTISASSVRSSAVAHRLAALWKQNQSSCSACLQLLRDWQLKAMLAVLNRAEPSIPASLQGCLRLRTEELCCTAEMPCSQSALVACALSASRPVSP